MFKLARKREVLWPVTIQTARDGGETDEHEINLRFQLLTNSELSSVSKMTDEESGELLRSKIKGWSEVFDEDGNALEFSEANLAACLDLPEFSFPASIALVQASRGARAKNS
jgi:hypothetical protein